MPKQKKRWITLGIVLLFVIVGILFIANWRTIGKQMANPLQDLLGIERVAQIETAIFKAQDQIEQWKYDLGFAQAENPFGVTASSAGGSATQTAELPAENPPPTETVTSPTATPLPTDSPVDSEATAVSTEIPPTSTNTPTPTPLGWVLADIESFGELQGEGIWQPYIYSPDQCVSLPCQFVDE